MEANSNIFSPKLENLAKRVEKLKKWKNRPKKEQLGILKSGDDHGFYRINEIDRGKKKAVAFELPEIIP